MKKVKKRKLCLIIVVSILIGIIASVGISYALAATLINSKDVSYQDNSNLAADNVQSAIDGTCSKIDTRLSTIEDKLYTVKDISFKSPGFPTSSTPVYTGASITFPAKSYCSIVVVSIHSTGGPRNLFFSSSSTDLTITFSGSYDGNADTGNDPRYMPYSNYFPDETTYYIWAQHVGDGIGQIQVLGFCATKYK